MAADLGPAGQHVVSGAPSPPAHERSVPAQRDQIVVNGLAGLARGFDEIATPHRTPLSGHSQRQLLDI